MPLGVLLPRAIFIFAAEGVPPAMTDVGLKVIFVPEGLPLAESATLCGEPLVRIVLIVTFVLFPRWSVTLVGLAAIEKSSAPPPPPPPPLFPQPGSWKEPIQVVELKFPFCGRYSFVYQNVQSSLGSMLMLE
jgi:hypothetical protein